MRTLPIESKDSIRELRLICFQHRPCNDYTFIHLDIRKDLAALWDHQTLSVNLLRKRYIIYEGFYIRNSMAMPQVVVRFVLFTHHETKYWMFYSHFCPSRVSLWWSSVLKIFRHSLLEHRESNSRGTFFLPCFLQHHSEIRCLSANLNTCPFLTQNLASCLKSNQLICEINPIVWAWKPLLITVPRS